MSGSATGLGELESILEHRFARPDLLARAVTHASAEQRSFNTYERLEFLGDRVLALVIAAALLERFPDEQEGALARRHADLVRKEALARVAHAIGLGRFLKLSKGEREAGAAGSDTILSDVMEAVIAALYLDAGLEQAQTFIMREWTELIEAARQPPQDPKTALQEWAQGRGLPLPAYETLAQDGPAHAPEFTVSVLVKGQPAQTAKGRSKRQAETSAAASLLDHLEP